MTKDRRIVKKYLAGIYGIVSTIHMLITFYHQPQGSILIVCDGAAALQKSMQPWTSNPLDKQFNIIRASWNSIRNTKLQWTSKHIKGHQDQVAIALCSKAYWNDVMDQAAKQHWQHIQMSLDPITNSLLSEPWELWLKNEKVSTAIKSLLLKHTSRQVAWDYWANKPGLEEWTSNQ